MQLDSLPCLSAGGQQAYEDIQQVQMRGKQILRFSFINPRLPTRLNDDKV